MEKYSVTVFIGRVNKKGQLTESNNFEYEFSSGNLIKDRKKAIKRTKKLLENIEDFLPKGQTFSSIIEAEMKGFKDYNCFSIDINFVNKEGDMSPIFGCSPEETFEWLEYEYEVFKRNSLYVKSVEIENPYGELIRVISDDLDFLLC